MKKIALASTILCSLFLAQAYADSDDHSHKDRDDRIHAPEMAAAGAVAGVSLLAGGIAVLRGRRNKK